MFKYKAALGRPRAPRTVAGVEMPRFKTVVCAQLKLRAMHVPEVSSPGGFHPLVSAARRRGLGLVVSLLELLRSADLCGSAVF